MAELLFIATTIFVAYVVFVVVGDKKDKMGSPAASEIVKPEPVTTAAAEPVKTAVAEEKKPAARAASAKPKATEATPSDSIKNPQTGEIAKIPTNYAFAKRWIKDALVAEGLLEKVYKNNELDDATQAKIHEALNQLKAMDNYR